MTSNIPEYYKEVSVRLNGVLDAIGLREDIRWKRVNMWIQSEETISLVSAERRHYFGSQAEATTTPDLLSDIDNVICLNITAVQDGDTWVNDNISLLVVSDENTPPGFVNLQPLYNGQPLPVENESHGELQLDRYGPAFLCNTCCKRVPPPDEQHGPANTDYLGTNIVGFKMAMDSVYAVKLYTWPDKASHWVTRNRCHNWPTQETILLIQKTGALLVPVGHKRSQDQHLEWRVSISYGEKLLMWLFNSTQYKCYIILKMINKRFIRPVVDSDMLSSYHLKTCMFYLIENTPAATWQPDNLLVCIEMCLRLLYIWVESKICPNYFIPEENMFQGKLYGHIPGKLLGVLSDLLRLECRYLVKISCDKIGEKLVRACQSPLTDLELQGDDITPVLVTSLSNLSLELQIVVEIAVRMDWRFGPRLLNRLFFCQEPRWEVNTILLKFLCSFIGSKLASESLYEEAPDQHALDMANELLFCGSSSDVTSGKLKLAAFYLVQEHFNISEDVLYEIHTKYSYKILDQNETYKHILHAILSEDLSTAKLISQYIAFSVHYHRSELNCIPKALIPEIFRSAGSDEIALDENNLPSLASVDPKCYLYFLEFLCYHRQNKKLPKRVALDNVIYVIQNETLEFKDTALNLLAYCLRQEGSMISAYKILCKSMKLRKNHNAAKWQIATIINAAARVLRG